MINATKMKQNAEQGLWIAEQSTGGNWRCTYDDPHHETFDESDAVVSDLAELPFNGLIVGTMWHDGLHIGCRREDALFIADARTRAPEAYRNVIALAEENAAQSESIKHLTEREGYVLHAIVNAFEFAGQDVPPDPLLRGPAYLGDQLGRALREIERLIAERETLKAENAKLRAELRDTQTSLGGLVVRLNVMDREHTALVKVKEMLLRESDDLRCMIHSAEDAEEAMTRKAEEHYDRAVKAEAELDDLRAELARVKPIADAAAEWAMAEPGSESECAASDQIFSAIDSATVCLPTADTAS